MKVIPTKPLRGEVNLPGDKSISHRAILLSALAEGTSQIENLLIAGVTKKMLSAVEEFGINWKLEENSLMVEGKGFGSWTSPEEPIDCGNSATTLRMLAGACSAVGISATLTGSPGLQSRPMDRIVLPLQQMGVEVLALGKEGRAPIQIRAQKDYQRLKTIHYISPIASAQVKSAILIAGLSAEETIRYQEPSSSRDHTERMLSSMGVNIQQTDRNDGSVFYVMEPLRGNSLNPLKITIPGDISSASFLIVAGLITPGSEITIPNVGLNPTRIGLLEVLQEMGASITIQKQTLMGGEPAGEVIVRNSRLRGINLNGAQVVRMIDEIPIFAIAAACAEGKTRVRGARELRYKETDRLTAVQQELSRIGVEIQEVVDGFDLQGGAPFQGGIVNSRGDHRIAMALAVAGLVAQNPLHIQNADIIHESFPGFVPTLQQLGGEVEL